MVREVDLRTGWVVPGDGGSLSGPIWDSKQSFQGGDIGPILSRSFCRQFEWSLSLESVSLHPYCCLWVCIVSGDRSPWAPSTPKHVYTQVSVTENLPESDPPTCGGWGLIKQRTKRRAKESSPVGGWGYSQDAFLETKIAPLWGLLFLPPHWAHPETDGPPSGCSCTHEQRYSFRSSWPQEHFESEARRSRLPTPYSGGCGRTALRGDLFQECVFSYIFRMRCSPLSALLRLAWM